MKCVNNTTILGNLVYDAVLDKAPINGVPTDRCRFRVAVDEKRANGEPVVTYFDVTLWRDRAVKNAKWLKKGRGVYVNGHVRLNQYTDSHGVNRATLQLHDVEFTFLEKKPEEEIPPQPVEENQAEPSPEDELPF